MALSPFCGFSEKELLSQVREQSQQQSRFPLFDFYHPYSYMGSSSTVSASQSTQRRVIPYLWQIELSGLNH